MANPRKGRSKYPFSTLQVGDFVTYSDPTDESRVRSASYNFCRSTGHHHRVTHMKQGGVMVERTADPAGNWSWPFRHMRVGQESFIGGLVDHAHPGVEQARKACLAYGRAAGKRFKTRLVARGAALLVTRLPDDPAHDEFMDLLW